MLHQKMADNSLHLAITVDGRNTVVIITADELDICLSFCDLLPHPAEELASGN